MTQSDLKNIRLKLPKNGVNIICGITGFKTSHVNMVLAGKRSNQIIIDTAIRIAMEHQKAQQEKINLIKSL
jgi:hypothetical protein